MGRGFADLSRLCVFGTVADCQRGLFTSVYPVQYRYYTGRDTDTIVEYSSTDMTTWI